ncbi:MAG: zinc ribbon domain-containing protein [Oscillospiraceae bacterium]|nr:zinc ribbon domain-containing protein [Oscillospiraceae bacterium]
MNCMKCGREIEAGQVFCGECLAEMEKYPVKPGIAIQLPKPREIPIYKKAMPRRRAATPEEQIKRLRRVIRILAALLLLCCILIGLMVYPTVSTLLAESKPKPGQNYSSVTDSTAESNLTETAS